ncbi:MAG: hypothetical protein AB8B87_12220 [Granulosicoccus sp.]
MNDIFKQLKAIMQPVTGSLNVTLDEPGHLDVYTHNVMKNGKPRWFGGVRIQKNYVSYYLMPVYENPQLVSGISPELKKCMKGKSCFNFKAVDKPLLKELSQLTKQSLKDYKAKGYMSDN